MPMQPDMTADMNTVSNSTKHRLKKSFVWEENNGFLGESWIGIAQKYHELPTTQHK